MGAKLLFLVGIVAAHGALGAVWVQQEPFKASPAIATCVNTSAPLPYFEPARELLAMRTDPTVNEVQLLP
jgi:hypothetical protein